MALRDRTDTSSPGWPSQPREEESSQVQSRCWGSRSRPSLAVPSPWRTSRLSTSPSSSTSQGKYTNKSAACRPGQPFPASPSHRVLRPAPRMAKLTLVGLDDTYEFRLVAAADRPPISTEKWQSLLSLIIHLQPARSAIF